MKGIWIIAGAVAVLGGCAARYQPAPAPRVEIDRNAGTNDRSATERDLLQRYRRERDCEGPSYARAHQHAVDTLDLAASAPTEAGGVPEAMGNGRFRMELAEAARRKHCVEVARKGYQEILEIFTGTPYAPLRRRATAGLNGLPAGHS
ncbi:MAG: hypothetical protein JOZ05_08605 [Acetobacteraceae bacterium]|nr:hypothetical protein [Acetobacteraceae bacterium]